MKFEMHIVAEVEIDSDDAIKGIDLAAKQCVIACQLLEDHGAENVRGTIQPGHNDKFNDGAPVPQTPHEGGGAIPMPSSGQLEEEEADRQRSWPDDLEAELKREDFEP